MIDPAVAALIGIALGWGLNEISSFVRWRREKSTRWDASRKDAYADLMGAFDDVKSRWGRWGEEGDIFHVAERFEASLSRTQLLAREELSEALGALSWVVLEMKAAPGGASSAGAPSYERLRRASTAVTASMRRELGIGDAGWPGVSLVKAIVREEQAAEKEFWDRLYRPGPDD